MWVTLVLRVVPTFWQLQDQSRISTAQDIKNTDFTSCAEPIKFLLVHASSNTKDIPVETEA